MTDNSYYGKHGEDNRAAVMWPRRHVRGMSDLDIMHQEAFAKLLGMDAAFELEYS